MDNMREGDKHFILTVEEHIQIAKIDDIQRASTMQTQKIADKCKKKFISFKLLNNKIGLMV
ncbi:hypothetical protein [Bartonella sp. AR 15-3]|uniref:hypothetical protein n=1 Tax=Bartonella sp. AR 15-3 TaxID=545617 RepID=UPI0013018F48|nr:hypothetical protein [Bartonella sp. AR 15-3]